LGQVPGDDGKKEEQLTKYQKKKLSMQLSSISLLSCQLVHDRTSCSEATREELKSGEWNIQQLQ